jgi:hypothetical protein
MDAGVSEVSSSWPVCEDAQLCSSEPRAQLLQLRLDVQCPPKAYVLRAWFPGRHPTIVEWWKLKEMWPCGRSIGHWRYVLKEDYGTPALPLLFLPPAHEVSGLLCFTLSAFDIHSQRPKAGTSKTSSHYKPFLFIS